MDNLEKLNLRKAELKAKIEAQKIDLKNTVAEIRENFEPASLLKNALTGLFNPADNTTPESTGIMRYSAPLLTVLGVLVRNSRWAFVLKWVAPLLLQFVPGGRKNESAVPEIPAPPQKNVKARFYAKLREGVRTLRHSLHAGNAEKKADSGTTTPEI